MQHQALAGALTRQAWRAWPVVLAAALVTIVLGRDLGRWPIWYDEGFTSMMLRYGPGEMIERTTDDVHPPLYYLVLDGWSAVFGDGLVALRAFSLVCMVAAALVIARIGQVTGLTRSRWQAALVVLAAGFGSVTITYAQEARMYGLGSLLVSVSTLALVRLHQAPSRRRVLGYGASVAACAYTHYFSLGFVIVHALWVLARSQGPLVDRLRAARWFAAAMAVAAALFVPWLPSLAEQLTRVGGDFWVDEVTWETPIKALYGIFSGETLLAGAPIAVLVLALLVPIYVVVHGALVARPSQRRDLLLLVLPLPLTILALYILSLDALGFSSVLIPRYLSQLAPLAYGGIAAAALVAFDRDSPVRWAPAIVAALVFAYGASLSVPGVSREFRAELDPVVEYVLEEADGGDLIVVDRYYHFYGLFHHFDADARVRVLEESDHYGGHSLLRGRDDILLELDEIADVDERVWLVRDDRVLLQYRERTDAAFARWTVASRETIDQLEVVELEPPSAGVVEG